MANRFWTSLPPLRIKQYAKPCLLTDECVIIATSTNDGGVFGYNLQQHKWFKIWKYPLGVEPLRHTIIIDKISETIYLYNNINSATDAFFEIDIRTKQCMQTYKGILHGVPDGVGYETGGNVELCLLNNKIHAIGGYINSYHMIWETSTTKLNKFKQYSIGNRSKNTTLHGHGIIPINSLNQILILGGKDSSMWGGFLRDIWCCEVNSNHINWTKLSKTTMPHKLSYFGYIMTFDEKYIIIFGGKNTSGLKDDIFILNISEWKWTKSKLKCPKKSKYYAIMNHKNDIYLFAIDSTKHWKLNLNKLIKYNHNNNNNSHISNAVYNKELKAIKQLEKEKELQRIDNVAFKKINEEKHYEETIDTLKMANNELSHRTVNLHDELKQLKTLYVALQNNYKNKQKEWIKKWKLLQNNMNKKDNKYSELNIKYQKLLLKEKHRTLNSTLNYKQWSCNDIIDWISYLEYGRYEKYLQILRINLKKEKIRGIHLTDLDKHDIHRLASTRDNVIEYPDKIALLKHFNGLNSNTNVSVNSNTNYNSNDNDNDIDWDKDALFAHICV